MPRPILFTCPFHLVRHYQEEGVGQDHGPGLVLGPDRSYAQVVGSEEFPSPTEEAALKIWDLEGLEGLLPQDLDTPELQRHFQEVIKLFC